MQWWQQKPGWQNIIFRPFFPKAAPDAGAEILTIRGKAASFWNRQGESITWRITVPAGCTGTVYLPGQTEPVQVSGGSHLFTWQEA